MFLYVTIYDVCTICIADVCTICICIHLNSLLINYADLLHLIHRSSTPNPDSKMISQVWDFKKWMDPFLGTVTGHSKYLAFRFTLDSSSRAEMHYKRFSSSPWEPQDSGIHILVVCTQLSIYTMHVTYLLVFSLHTFRLKLLLYIYALIGLSRRYW